MGGLGAGTRAAACPSAVRVEREEPSLSRGAGLGHTARLTLLTCLQTTQGPARSRSERPELQGSSLSARSSSGRRGWELGSLHAAGHWRGCGNSQRASEYRGDL